MNLDRFVRSREVGWAELQALVVRAGDRPERLGPDGVRRLGALYRVAVADLAQARRRFPQEPVVGRLEELVGRARRLVYDVRPRRASLWAFLTTGYWRRVRERPWPLAAAALMLFGPWVLAAVWAVGDPGAAVGVMPSEYRVVADPDHFEGGSDELDAEAQTAFSSLIFTNNIRVAFIVFVGGIAVGLGTVAMLVYQGVIFGAITGMAVWAGNGPPFFELVSPHGVLELSCIVVAGAAGLRLGWALVDPGHRRRGAALVVEGRRATEAVLGTVPWLVVAGVVEGFVTPARIGLGPAVALGVALGAVYWSLVAWRGGLAEEQPAPVLTAAPGSSP